MTEQDFEQVVITLTAEEAGALERLSDEAGDDDVAFSAEVIQWYAMGRSTEEIVRASGLDSDAVLCWKARFLEFGVAALSRQSPEKLTKRRC